MHLNEYRSFVRSRAIQRSGQPIHNSSIEHAAIIIETLFAHAHKQVDILTGNFNPRVYGRSDVITEAMLFLAADSENKIRIIVEDDSLRIKRLHPFFERLLPYKNLELRKADSELQQRYGFHFVVVDDDCYRFEPDKALPSAIAVFGDQAGATNLQGVFSKLWDRSKKVESLPTA